MPEAFNGKVEFRTTGGSHVFIVDPDSDQGHLTGHDQSGRLVFDLDSQFATAYVGAAGNEGDVIVRDSEGRDVHHLNGEDATLYVGAAGNEGDVIVRDLEGRDVHHLNGEDATLYVGAAGNEGDVIVRDPEGREVFHFDGEFAALYVGAAGNEGDVILRNDTGRETIHLDGGAGDIILRNADCAEDFNLSSPDAGEPGTVMVLSQHGGVRPCDSPYDRRVAGVVSGAGGLRPGIVLGRRPGGRRCPLALVGTVFCQADASHGPIEMGDMLTTSSTPGHAMMAADPLRAFGAVLGKALAPLPSGRGLVPVLVALQ